MQNSRRSVLTDKYPCLCGYVQFINAFHPVTSSVLEEGRIFNCNNQFQQLQGRYFIYARKRQLVWQGRGVATLKPDAPPTEREKSFRGNYKDIVEISDERISSTFIYSPGTYTEFPEISQRAQR